MRNIFVSLTILLITASFIAVSCVSASDYKGQEKEDSIFQKLGDLINGKYEIEGKPLKKIGLFQCAADRVKEIEPASNLKK